LGKTGRVNKKGAGRPVGSLSIRTKALRAISDEALAAGITPFEVMLDNMRFYYTKADVLLTAILAGINDKKKPMEMLEALKELGSFRDKAQACAADAAPYAHARLSATTVDGTITHKVEEAAEAFKLIEGTLEATVTGEVVPMRKKSEAA
jgi:hypothetical protein